MEVSRPPPSGEARAEYHRRYLEAVNTCFPAWGDAQKFRWCFERSTSAPKADLMVLTEEEQWLAGSAVTYWRVRIGARTPTVGIMTGSWTLPASRGRGCFTRIIDLSRKAVAKRGGEALLAFVVASNPSCRRLKAAGAAMHPAAYAIGEVEQAPKDAPASNWTIDDPDERKQLGVNRVSPLDERVRFEYPQPSDWQGQFLQRPLRTTIASRDSGQTYLVEEAGDTDRLLDILPGSSHAGATDTEAGLRERWNFAASRGRKFFCYGSTALEMEIFAELGLNIVDGYITVLPASDDSDQALWPVDLELEICNGDRM
jgi:hypothetical protein